MTFEERQSEDERILSKIRKWMCMDGIGGELTEKFASTLCSAVHCLLREAEHTMKERCAQVVEGCDRESKRFQIAAAIRREKEQEKAVKELGQ